MANRKDQKGRVLKTGENQRKDGIYQYRYTDLKGIRKTIYASDLKKLREKEEEIRTSMQKNLDYAKGNIRVIELVEQYLSLKNGVKPKTIEKYIKDMKRIQKYDFSSMPIKSVKMSQAKQFIIEISHTYSFNTISGIKSRLTAAFNMAVEEDILLKNPFEFKLSSVVLNDSNQRVALTSEQIETWLSFLKTDAVGQKHYDLNVFLLETGIRISELCGLTIKDIDLINNRISINHQLLFDKIKRKNYITTPKSKSGSRIIPLSLKAREALKRVLNNRPKSKVEWVVDGYSQFVFIQKNGKPKNQESIRKSFRYLIKKYNKKHPIDPLPLITPHVLRHTFCTQKIQNGMNPKALQYLMGHSKMDITVNLYSHSNQDFAEEEFKRVEGL